MIGIEPSMMGVFWRECSAYRRLRFSSDADNVRLTNACIIII